MGMLAFKLSCFLFCLVFFNRGVDLSGKIKGIVS